MGIRRVRVSCIFVAALAAACDENRGVDDRVPCVNASLDDEACIPGGSFLMGHSRVPSGAPDCEALGTCVPYWSQYQDFDHVHRVVLSPFFLDVLAVTDAQYKECFDAGMCRDECQAFGCGGGLFAIYSFHDPQLADYPVQTATIDGAEEYCRWVGKRLPTEAEWERAARGRDSADYPWGNDAPDCRHYLCRACTYLPCAPGTVPVSVPAFRVGSIEGDRSPEGVRELVSNSTAILADSWDFDFYGRSPEKDPANVQHEGLRSVRGGIGIRVDATVPGVPRYHGLSYPLPAWIRGEAAQGGIRCARSDSYATNAGVRQRQALQRGLQTTVGGH